MSNMKSTLPALLFLSLAMPSDNASAQYVKQRNTSTYIFLNGQDLGASWGLYANQFVMKPNLTSWTGQISTIQASYDTKLSADDGSTINPTSLPSGAQPLPVNVTVASKANSYLGYIWYWSLQYNFGVSDVAGESFLTKQANTNSLTFGLATPISGGGSSLVAPHGIFLSEIYLLGDGTYPIASVSDLHYSNSNYSFNVSDTEVSFASNAGVVYQAKRYSFYTNDYAGIDPNISFTLSPVPELTTTIFMISGLLTIGAVSSRKKWHSAAYI